MESQPKQPNPYFKFFFYIFLICMAGRMKAQGWQWARSGGGIASDAGYKTCVDPSGNVFVAGYFYSNSINVGTITISNAGASGADIFLAKYNSSGAVQWAQRIGGSGSESLGGICSDANGNVYVSGYFTSTLISLPPYSIGNPNPANSDIFVVSFNSFGTAQWMSAYGSAADERCSDIAYSSSMTCLYITGYYYGSTLAIGANTINNTSISGKCDMYLAKLTTAGSVSWVRTTGSINADDIPYSVASDGAGSPCVGGVYSPNMINGTTTIGSNTLSSYGSQDVFICRYDNLGSFQWARGIGSNGGGDYFGGIKCDASNNICLSGYFNGSTLSIGNATFAGSGGYDIFMGRYSSIGAYQLSNKIGGPLDDYGWGIAVDGNSNMYIIGTFSGTNIAVGATTLTNTNPGASLDMLVAKYSPSGSANWATKASGASDEWGYGITSDALGNVYVTGNFNVAGPTAFGSTTVNSSGGTDFYLAKIACLTPMITGPSTVCTGGSATLVASGAATYSWSNGASGASLVITPTANTSYSVIGINGGCQVNGPSMSVSLAPANINAGPNLTLTCAQFQQINAVTTPSNPVNVTWSPTIGLSNPFVLSPSVNAVAINTQYTVTANLNNGCSASTILNVSGTAITPSICMVTVDSVGQNNLILWDKSAYPRADTFFVYRDIANNNYQLIGKVPKTATYGEFLDTVRTLYAANGDPNVSAWRYKINYKDSCGFISAMSPYHKTMFMQNNAGNFTWNDYLIEGQPVPVPVLQNYVFRRDNNANGNWQNIQTLSAVSTAYTDPNYGTYISTADWRAQTIWSITCSSNYLKTAAAVVKVSRSNISNNRIIHVSIKNTELESGIVIYPNPAKDILNVCPAKADLVYEVLVEDILGQKMLQRDNIYGKVSLELSEFSKGIYTLRIKSSEGNLLRKIIIE